MKFVYASLYDEGEHSEEFGKSKRSIPSDQKTYWNGKKDRHVTLRFPHLCDEAKVDGEGIQAVFVLEVGA